MFGSFMNANRFDTDDLDEDVKFKERPAGGFLVAFVERAFHEFFGFVLWGVLIVCIILGYMNLGSLLEDVFDSRFLGKLVGLVIGAVIGIFTIIAFGGVIATLLAIKNNTAKMLSAIAKTDSSATPASPMTVSDAMSTPPLGMSDAPKDSALIKSEQTLSGVIRYNKGRDLYHVVLKQPGKLSIMVTTADEGGLLHWESNVKVLDANGKPIITSGKFEFPYSVELDLPNAGIYVIEITSSKAGKYYLTAQY